MAVANRGIAFVHGLAPGGSGPGRSGPRMDGAEARRCSCRRGILTTRVRNVVQPILARTTEAVPAALT